MVTGAELGPLLAALRDGRRAVGDEEEADAAMALDRDLLAGFEGALFHRAGQLAQLALIEALEEGYALDEFDRCAHGCRILSSSLAAREFLDLAVRRVELRSAEGVQLLAALPELDRLIERRLAGFQPLDDLLELVLRALERQLAHRRRSSTRAPKPPSASSTSTRVSCSRPSVPRMIRSPARTIA